MLDYHIALNLNDDSDDYYLNIEEVDDDLVVNRFVVVVEHSLVQLIHNQHDDEEVLEDYVIVLRKIVESVMADI